MVLEIRSRRPDRRSVRGAAPLAFRHIELEDALAHQIARHFLVELVDEPFGQSAHFGALGRLFRHQPLVAHEDATGLVEIFAGNDAADDRRPVILDHHGKGRGRVHRQKGPPPLPGPLFDQFAAFGIFAEEQPDITRGGRHGMMIQLEHSPGSIANESGLRHPGWKSQAGCRTSPLF